MPSTSSNENGKVKLKSSHWDKFDGDLMEALFGYVATNRKSPRQDSNSTNPRGDRSDPASRIFILDTRKSQNIAIVLKSLGVSHKEIIDVLVKREGLNADTLEKLTKISPTNEEASEIFAFDGNPTILADAQSFLYHLLKAFPSAFTHSMPCFSDQTHTEFSDLKKSLKSLESTCNELRTRGLFNLKGGKSRVMLQLALKFPSSDCTLLRTRSRPQSDCFIPNKIQPQVSTRIRTPTLPFEASLMLIVPSVELCPE
ncbi:formin-like protein 4 [Forsythia ovata]|uniref:Formin-like protein 4 n=1 Tax=Forsythia ovata TaxID=205694 RepID=A0ABD1TVA4_9LAMI